MGDLPVSFRLRGQSFLGHVRQAATLGLSAADVEELLSSWWVRLAGCVADHGNENRVIVSWPVRPPNVRGTALVRLFIVSPVFQASNVCLVKLFAGRELSVGAPHQRSLEGVHVVTGHDTEPAAATL